MLQYLENAVLGGIDVVDKSKEMNKRRILILEAEQAMLPPSNRYCISGRAVVKGLILEGKETRDVLRQLVLKHCHTDKKHQCFWFSKCHG